MSFWELMMIVLVVIPLILLWVFTLVDIFKRQDLSGLAKALWAIAILFLPLIGMIVYFVTRPPTPIDQSELIASEKDVPSAAPFDPTVGAGTPTTSDQLAQLSSLHDSGKLTDEEFTTSKAELLGGQDGG
jgi:hypothetical protein